MRCSCNRARCAARKSRSSVKADGAGGLKVKPLEARWERFRADEVGLHPSPAAAERSGERADGEGEREEDAEGAGYCSPGRDRLAGVLRSVTADSRVSA